MLLVSLLLQSCGIEVPTEQLQGGRSAMTQGGPIAESREGSSAFPQMQQGGRLSAQTTSGTDSTSSSVGSSPAPSNCTSRGTTRIVNTGQGAQPTPQSLSEEQFKRYVYESTLTST